MDDNVMEKYSNPVTSARLKIQYDLGMWWGGIWVLWELSRIVQLYLGDQLL